MSNYKFETLQLHVGQVVFVVVGKLFRQLCLRQTAVDEVQDLFLVILLLHLGSLPAHSGHKKYTASVMLDSCGVSWAHAVQDAADSFAWPASQEKRCLG